MKIKSSQNQGKFCALNLSGAALAVTLTSVAMLTASQAGAAGFEKSVWWDAHYGAFAGAAQSEVTGAQSLFWNPAALAGSNGLQVNGDFSPTWAQYSGPMSLNSNTVQNSNTALSPVGAAFVSYGITPQWGVGVGYYVSAGTRADYDAVTPGTFGGTVTYAPPIKSDLTITELSAGTGYELIPGLKIGAAYRLVFVHANVDVAGASGANLVATQISNASSTQAGFRVGLQYSPKDAPWGVGVVYRNQTRFVANGTANVTVANSSAPAGISGGQGENVQLSGVLPQRVDAAAHYQFTPTFTGLVGYAFSNYSQESALGISGVSVLGGAATTEDVPLNWTNGHDIRVAGEYTGFMLPVRLGFDWASQVIPKGNALPILPAPGPGYTVIAGTGYKVTQNLTLDGAFEYSWDSGSVASSDNPAATTGTGNYSANATVVHLSGTYVF